MFTFLGSRVSRYWPLVIGFWLALAVGLHSVAPRWNEVTHDGDLAYLPELMPSVQGQAMLVRAFPEQRAKSQMAIVIERPSGKLRAGDLRVADALADRFERLSDQLPIVDVWNRSSEVVGEKLTSKAGPNGQATVIVLQLANELMATDNMRVLRHVNEMLDEVRQDSATPAGLTLGLTGSAAIGGDMLASAAESIKNTELTTVVLVVVILLLVYRAPILVVIPLLTIGVALFVSIDLLALLTRLNRLEGFDWWHFKVFTTTKIFIVVILFGAGTDFCLFLVARYREELARGLARREAVTEAVAQVGHALVGSALTTIVGLAMMYFAAFGKFRSSGPAIALCLTVTLLACLTLAPALMRATGRVLFWPFGFANADAGRKRAAVFGSFWQWAARMIVAYPGRILVVSLLLLAPLAWRGLSLQITYDFLNELQMDRPSVVGAAMARRHFSPGETGPTTLLAYRENADFDSAAGRQKILELTGDLYSVPGIDRVRSVVEPTGDRPGKFSLRSSSLKKLALRKHKRTAATYLTQVADLKGDVARFDMVMHDQPFSPEAVESVSRAEEHLARLSADEASFWHDAQFFLVGTTVAIRDLKAVTESDQILIQQLVMLGVLGVLILILRRPLVCLYLIASVLLSYLVTVGATQWFFEWRYGDSFHGLDWKVPIFLFVILIAVGEDYNIYLVTRVLEEQRRHGPLAGLQVAVARTGGIITSCGVIMAGTFISMMTGTLRGMLELGFALSLGVMLDTCIVRPVLVPAFLALLEKAKARWRPAAPGMHASAGRPLTSQAMAPR